MYYTNIKNRLEDEDEKLEYYDNLNDDFGMANYSPGENRLPIVKKFESIKTDIHKIEYIKDNVVRDCHNKSFYSFEYSSILDFNFKKIKNQKKFNLTVSDKSMFFFEFFY